MRVQFEQRKVSCVLCRMKKLRSFCWWYCSSAQLTLLPSTSHIAGNPLGSQSDIYQPQIFRTRAFSGDIIVIYIPRYATGTVCRDTQGFFSDLSLLLLHLPRFFVIKTVFSSLVIFQMGKPTTQGITHLFWCNWSTFWRKNAARNSAWWFCSYTKMPRLTGH